VGKAISKNNNRMEIEKADINEVRKDIATPDRTV